VPEPEAELKEALDDDMVTSVSDTIPNYEERIRPTRDCEQLQSMVKELGSKRGPRLVS
jgi:hypothetical protein